MIAKLRALPDLVTRNWPVAALGASAFMLGMAHYFETFQHLAPCILCLKQREAYWIAGSVALAGVAASYSPWRGLLYRLFCLALAIAFGYGLYLAAWHAGAEQKWWDGPQACAIGAGATSASDLLAQINGAAPAGPSCEEPVWWFLGLTMAGWNVIISTILVIWSLVAGLKGVRR